MPSKMRTDIPPISLEPLHRSIKDPCARPVHGVALILVIACLVLVGLFAGTEENDLPEVPQVLPPLRPTGAERGGGGSRPLTRHEIEERERIEKIRKQIKEEALSRPAPEEPEKVDLGPVPAGHVRVAVVQFFPEFGKPDRNRERVRVYIERAAEEGAKIVVLPEASLPGYAKMNEEVFWCSGKPEDEDHVDVQAFAETRSGEHVRFMTDLAKRLGIYLTVPFIEKAGDKLHSTVMLIDPSGNAAAIYRKRQAWKPGDGKWLSPGKAPSPVVATPFGRIGLTMTYDFPQSVSELVQGRADVVLWSATFSGKNFETLFRSNAFRDRVTKAGFSLALANWTYLPTPWWEGHGHSRIMHRQGRTLAQAADNDREMLVIQDLPFAPEK